MCFSLYFYAEFVFNILHRRSMVKLARLCWRSWQLSRPMWMVLGHSRAFRRRSWAALGAYVNGLGWETIRVSVAILGSSGAFVSGLGLA